MVNLRAVAGYIVGGLLIVAAVLGTKTSLDNGNRYGWNYDIEIRIQGDTFVDIIMDTISIRGELLAEAFLATAGILLITSNYARGNFKFTYSGASLTSSNIEFVQKKPEHWDIWYDPRSYSIGVVLDDVGITFPVTMVEKWIGEVLNEEKG